MDAEVETGVLTNPRRGARPVWVWPWSLQRAAWAAVLAKTGFTMRDMRPYSLLLGIGS